MVQVFEGVRLLVCVLDVGFIKDNDDMVRDGGHEVVQLLLVDHGAERVGGVGDVDEARLRRDGAEGGLEIGREVRLVGDGDVFSVDGLGKDFVEGETVVSSDGVGARAEEDEAEEEKELTASRNGDDLFHGDIMEGGDALAAGEGGTVRVEVGFPRSALHGAHGQGRGSERVFIGCELDDLLRLHADFASGFLNGFAGLVGNERGDVGIGGEHGLDLEFKI